jgi:hypothetical protein
VGFHQTVNAQRTLQLTSHWFAPDERGTKHRRVTASRRRFTRPPPGGRRAAASIAVLHTTAAPHATVRASFAADRASDVSCRDVRDVSIESADPMGSRWHAAAVLSAKPDKSSKSTRSSTPRSPRRSRAIGRGACDVLRPGSDISMRRIGAREKSSPTLYCASRVTVRATHARGGSRNFSVPMLVWHTRDDVPEVSGPPSQRGEPRSADEWRQATFAHVSVAAAPRGPRPLVRAFHLRTASTTEWAEADINRWSACSTSAPRPRSQVHELVSLNWSSMESQCSL